MTTEKMSIIDQLKANRYAWGMWTEPECYGPELGAEMQEKAEEIEVSNFLRWLCRDCWGAPKDDVFLDGSVYRLRADYTDDPEIVECEIGIDSEGWLEYRGRNLSRPLHRAYEVPDFIGFKFEDGIVTGIPVRYKMTSGVFSTFAFIKNCAEIEVLHATHVLFRRQK